MFTGIIEETGTVISITKRSGSCMIVIQAKEVLDGTRVGDSISVNGVCLTVARLEKDRFWADVMPETLQRSTLGALKAGISIVNLERAVLLGGRLGGHIVSGHIDGTGKITEIRRDGNAVWYKIKTDARINRYIIEKGSITMDGISLTVTGTDAESFMVSVIPHTRAATALSQKVTGDMVNLENDCIGKYLEKFLIESMNQKGTGITREYLGRYGF